jgi:hypothetical protein
MNRLKERKKQPDNKTRYLMCGDHKKRRWSIVCIHLIRGTSHEWMVGDVDEFDGVKDWLCPACMNERDRIAGENGRPPFIDNIRPICVMCVEKIRAHMDPNYRSLS